MKKILSAVSAMLLAGTINASAEEVCYYDVSAYINNVPISCYCINDYCAVYASDLRNYGFNVEYSEEEKIVRITKKSEGDISGTGKILLPWQRNRTVYKTTGNSDIRVLLNGEETTSYNVDGKMMIFMENMGSFGELSWNSQSRTVHLTMPDFPIYEYNPLEKSKRTYTRAKKTRYDLNPADYSGYSTKEDDWGMVLNKGSEPTVYEWQKNRLAQYGAYYMDHAKPNKIYLTFDEGYEAGYTPLILDILKAYNIPATFFVTGSYLKEQPGLVQRMIDEGHSVGNHTQNHKNLAKLSAKEIMEELDGVSDALRNQFGYDTYYMRPPEGAYNERVLAVARDMGYNTMLWSFAYYDYDVSVIRGKNEAFNRIVPYFFRGSIPLLHAVSRDNAEALGMIIKHGLENGYEFVALDDLCNP